MHRCRAAAAALAVSLCLLPGHALAKRILGAGRASVVLGWEPASGPVAFYEVTCTVNGAPDVLVGTPTEPLLEIAGGADGWGGTLDACRVRAFAADGYPGPQSEPLGRGFQFLPDVDLDGNRFVGSSDVEMALNLFGRGQRGAYDVATLWRSFGCRVDPLSRSYVDCPGDATPVH